MPSIDDLGFHPRPPRRRYQGAAWGHPLSRHPARWVASEFVDLTPRFRVEPPERSAWWVAGTIARRALRLLVDVVLCGGRGW